MADLWLVAPNRVNKQTEFEDNPQISVASAAKGEILNTLVRPYMLIRMYEFKRGESLYYTVF